MLLPPPHTRIVRIACSILLLLCLPGFATALWARELKLKSYTVDNGLSQNTVWDYLVDERGFLWMGTADGIDRFDGERIVHYPAHPAGSSFLQTDAIFRFVEGRQRDIWVSSTKGLGYYERAKDSFRTIFLTKHWCTLLGEDNKGCIWFADGIDSIYAWQKQEGRLIRRLQLTTEKEWQTASTMNRVELPNHIVSVLDLTRVLVLNKKTGRFSVNTMDKLQAGNIAKLNDSTLLREVKGVFYHYQLVGDSLRLMTQIPSGRSDSIQYTCFEMFQGRLLAGGPMGLFELDPLNYTIKDSLLSAFDRNRNEFTYVQALKTDPKGRLFLCTNGAGLKIYDPGSNKFRHLRMESALDNMVKSIYALADGTVYAGLWGRGVVAYDTLGRGRLMTFGVSRKINSVVAIAKWSEDVLLLVQSNELTWYNYKKNRVEQVRKISDTQFFATPQYREGLLNVVCRTGSQLLAIAPDCSCTQVAYIPGTQIRSFLRYKGSGFLLGTSVGLLYYRGGNRKQDTLLKGIVIKDLYRQADSTIWLATTNGLYHFDANLQLLAHLERGKGLLNNFIYGIVEDRFGGLWFSHNKGISCLQTKTGTIAHYGVADGLQSNEFNTGAYFGSEKGFLYFGGVNGVNVIDPEQPAKDTSAVPLAWNQILVNDMMLRSDTVVNELQQLNLPYEQNTISFNFAALELCRPEACRYRYQLVGFDPHPIESGTTHFARYANLPAGNYVFRVWIANPDGLWSVASRSITLVIRKPFWQTGVFRIGIALLILLLLGLPVYWYLRSQRRKAIRQAEWRDRLDSERMRISRDLHDNVGAQLSYLINNIDWMQEHPEQLRDPAATERLRTLGDAGRNAMHTLRQTIWAFSHTAVSVEDFADRFKQFALRMLELNPDIQLQISEQIDPSQTLSPTLALNMFRMGQEAFNNSLKHSGGKRVSVSFRSDATYHLLITIEDDGKGFDRQQVGNSDSYGLQNMESRARESNLNWDVQSAVGKGTRVLIYLEHSTTTNANAEQ